MAAIAHYRTVTEEMHYCIWVQQIALWF